MHSPAPEPVIRLARPDDAAALAAFGRRSFSDTFAADNTADDMAQFLDATYGEALQRAELADPALTCFVATLGDSIIGSALLQSGDGPGFLNDAPAMELRRFYVDRTLHGAGVAAAMLGICIAQARAQGSAMLFLGVWERNFRAIRFYQKHGFHAVGTKVFMLGCDAQQDLVMALRLDDTR